MKIFVFNIFFLLISTIVSIDMAGDFNIPSIGVFTREAVSIKFYWNFGIGYESYCLILVRGATKKCE